MINTFVLLFIEISESNQPMIENTYIWQTVLLKLIETRNLFFIF